mmetsp:Transcript_24383/g.32646  ORF Transcript_24383/g.32646 Transcript_24383/m.32646 type:complete len:95 (-) Transcript_24383:1280-1564(-)
MNRAVITDSILADSDGDILNVLQMGVPWVVASRALASSCAWQELLLDDHGARSFVQVPLLARVVKLEILRDHRQLVHQLLVAFLLAEGLALHAH